MIALVMCGVAVAAFVYKVRERNMTRRIPKQYLGSIPGRYCLVIEYEDDDVFISPYTSEIEAENFGAYEMPGLRTIMRLSDANIRALIAGQTPRQVWKKSIGSKIIRSEII